MFDQNEKADQSLEESVPFTAAQNEQTDILSEIVSMQKAPATQIEDLFAFAEKKQATVLDDPFSMILGTNPTSQLEESKEESKTADLGGNSGGWGDDEDDIDMEEESKTTDNAGNGAGWGDDSDSIDID